MASGICSKPCSETVRTNEASKLEHGSEFLPGDVTCDNDEFGNRVASGGDRRPESRVITGSSLEDDFDKESKLEQGFGHNPDAIEEKLTRRIVADP